MGAKKGSNGWGAAGTVGRSGPEYVIWRVQKLGTSTGTSDWVCNIPHALMRTSRVSKFTGGKSTALKTLLHGRS